MLSSLPEARLDTSKRLRVKVRRSSTIRVAKNVYSVDSRLIDETVEVRLFAEHLEIYYAQQKVETLPRLRGEGRYHVEYRHVIDWLVCKPGAFENYRYRQDLFPTHRFRVALRPAQEPPQWTQQQGIPAHPAHGGPGERDGR